MGFQACKLACWQATDYFQINKKEQEVKYFHEIIASNILNPSGKKNMGPA